MYRIFKSACLFIMLIKCMDVEPEVQTESHAQKIDIKTITDEMTLDENLIKFKYDNSEPMVKKCYQDEFIRDKKALINALKKLLFDETLSNEQKITILTAFITNKKDFKYYDIDEHSFLLYREISVFFKELDRHTIFKDMTKKDETLKENIYFLSFINATVWSINELFDSDTYLFRYACIRLDNTIKDLTRKGMINIKLQESILAHLHALLYTVRHGTELFSHIIPDFVGPRLLYKDHLDFFMQRQLKGENFLFNYSFRMKWLEKDFNTLYKIIDSSEEDLESFKVLLKEMTMDIQTIRGVSEVIRALKTYDEPSPWIFGSKSHRLAYALTDVAVNMIMTLYGFDNENFYVNLEKEGLKNWYEKLPKPFEDKDREMNNNLLFD